MYVRAPWAPAAAATASRSAIRPSADWTALTATRAVPGRTASGIFSSGTVRTVRSGRMWKGLTRELKSPSATRTSEPGGRDWAISPP